LRQLLVDYSFGCGIVATIVVGWCAVAASPSLSAAAAAAAAAVAADPHHSHR